MVRAMMQLRPRAAVRAAAVPTSGKTRAGGPRARVASAYSTPVAPPLKRPRKPKRRVIMDEDDHARTKELLQQHVVGRPCMSVRLTILVTDVWTSIGDAVNHQQQQDDVYEAACSRELRPVLSDLLDWLRSMHDFLDCADNIQSRVAALHVWELVFAADHARHQHKFAMCHVFESAAITRRKMHIVAGEPIPKHQRVLFVFA